MFDQPCFFPPKLRFFSGSRFFLFFWLEKKHVFFWGHPASVVSKWQIPVCEAKKGESGNLSTRGMVTYKNDWYRKLRWRWWRLGRHWKLYQPFQQLVWKTKHNLFNRKESKNRGLEEDFPFQLVVFYGNIYVNNAISHGSYMGVCMVMLLLTLFYFLGLVLLVVFLRIGNLPWDFEILFPSP